MTVKLRSGLEPGGREGFGLAARLAEEAGVAGIALHPRSAATQHKGSPDYAVARELVERIDLPVIISGGLDTAESARNAYEASGADAVMIARGSLGNPWIFEELTDRRSGLRSEDVIAELLWVMDRAEEHLGADRAARYLRKFYPWYLERLDAGKSTAAAFQATDDLAEARSQVAAPVAAGRGVHQTGASPRCGPDNARVSAWGERGSEEEFRGRRIHVFRRGRGSTSRPPPRLPIELLRLAPPPRSGDRAR